MRTVVRSGLLGLVFLVAAHATAQGITAPLLERAGVVDAHITAVAQDGSGNIYFAGASLSEGSGEPLGSVDFDPGPGVWALPDYEDVYMMFVGKTDPDLNLVWLKRVRAEGRAGYLPQIAVNDNGDAVVVGNFFGPDGQTVQFGEPGDPYPVLFTNTDNFMWRLNSDGTTDWVKLLGGSLDNFGSVAMGPDDSVYLIGTWFGTADFDPGPGTYLFTNTGPYDYFILKLDVSGNFVWARQFEHTGVNVLANPGTNLVVAETGQVFAEGRIRGAIDVDPGPGVHLLSDGNGSWLASFTEDGDFIWARQRSGGEADSLHLDGAGGLLLHYGGLDIDLIARYSMGGELIWTRTFKLNAGDESEGTPLALAAGNDNDFYIWGMSNSSAIGTSVADFSYLDPEGFFLARWDVINNTQLWCTPFYRVGTGTWESSSDSEIFVQPGRVIIAQGGFYSVDADPSPGQDVVLAPFDGHDHYFIALDSHDEMWLDFDTVTQRPMDGTLEFPQRNLGRALRTIQPGQTINIVSPGEGIVSRQTGTYSKPATINVVGAPARIGVQP